MFLIDAIKLTLEKIFKNRFMGGESGAYKIKTVLFLFELSLLATINTLYKRNEKSILSNNL